MAYNRDLSMRLPSTSPLYFHQTVTDFCSMTGPCKVVRWKPRLALTPFHLRTTFGKNTADGKVSVLLKRRLSCRTTSKTAAARNLATTSVLPLTGPLKPSQKAKTAFSLLWQQAQVRLTLPSRSSGGCGRPNGKYA